MRTLTNVRDGLEKLVRTESGRVNPLTLMTVLTLFGGAALGIHLLDRSRTNDFPEYHFNGNIGSEQVIFKEYVIPNSSSLVVQKPDGRRVSYSLFERPDHTLVLEEVAVSTPAGGQNVLFSAKSPNQNIAAVMSTAKKDVDRYLAAIVTEKTRQYNSQAQPIQR